MFSATMAFGKLHKFIFLVLMFLILTAGVYAEKESGFPLEDFWSLDAELGMSGILVDGSSFQLVVDPKLWLSPTLMVGSRVGINYSVEDDTTNNLGNILTFEGQVYLRWNFLHLGREQNPVNVFFQAGHGLLSAYRGTDNPFNEVTGTAGLR